MVKRFALLGFLLLVPLGLLIIYILTNEPRLLSAEAPKVLRPLQRYSFNSLRKEKFPEVEIELVKIVNKNEAFTTYEFKFFAWGKKITGLANIPNNSNFIKTSGAKQKYPVIIMLRGYVDDKVYSPGMGTKRSADFLANNGFITLAPDFLGYGGSDKAYTNALQTRFDAPVEVLSLISSIESLKSADSERVGIWGHSNGGQIAISVLEIAHKPYPTTLWAPVTKPFPESILFYASEMPDRGEYLRKIIGDFEKDYDSRLYSITDNVKWINAPLQLHQGTKDESVPIEWSNSFIARMASLNKDVSYYTYNNENHNFNSGSWEKAIKRDLTFFKKWLF
ncbi:MAG: putative peptidase [Microgenomates group bacterium GW2011_GWA2_44_7]|nr:MAG: putative peptidase [Microgenomates group bacterium GW2011_GWA2_44_7]